MITEIAERDAHMPVGTPFAGGFFGWRYRDQHNGNVYALVVAGRAVELRGRWGEYDKDVPGAMSCTDGRANTAAMAEAGGEIAQQVLELNHNDCNDWAIPACDQLEVLYRAFKPTTQENACTFRDGVNPSGVPVGYPYTSDNPIQTVAEAFREGGAEAFADDWYWSSTQFSPDAAFVQAFSDGSQFTGDKTSEARVRPVRRVLIVPSPL